MFHGILRIGNGEGSLVVTIPNELIKFAGFKKGDVVKILIQKKNELDNNTIHNKRRNE